MDGLFRDVQYAIRIVVGAPGFALTAVLTLALGIGANVAMFSVVYGVLLRPLPYRDADRLVVVRSEVDYVGAHRPVPLSVPLAELNAWQRPFDGIAATAFYTANDVVALSGDNGSEVLDSAVVSSTFFATIAGPFAAGRPLHAGDDALPMAVISERLAHRLFGGPARAIGRELLLTPRLYTVVGVANGAFQFPSADVDVWRPAGFVRSTNPRCCFFQVVARLEPNGTVEGAVEGAVERAQAALHPMFQTSGAGKGRTRTSVRTNVIRVSDHMVDTVRPALVVLFASVLMVLFIACGNLINLLLARHAAREQEFAIRRALGASASRLMRQLLVESAILGAAGVACGIVLAQVSLTVFARVAGGVLPRIDAIHIDRPALLFAACLAVLATVLTGITPALQALRAAAAPNHGSGTTATPRNVRRLQRALCMGQVALAVILLVGATLMGRSLARLLDVDLSVATDHVLTASLSLAFGDRPTDADTIARIDRVIDHIRALPGVRAVGVGTSVPPSLSRMRVTLRRSGDVVDYQAAAVPATPGYFSALQMRLIKGRFFTDADDDHHPRS